MRVTIFNIASNNAWVAGSGGQFVVPGGNPAPEQKTSTSLFVMKLEPVAPLVAVCKRMLVTPATAGTVTESVAPIAGVLVTEASVVPAVFACCQVNPIDAPGATSIVFFDMKVNDVGLAPIVSPGPPLFSLVLPGPSGLCVA